EPPARRAGRADPEDAERGAAARLRDRAVAGAGDGGRADDRGGVAVPSAVPAGAAGVDPGGVGRLGAGAEGEVLQADVAGPRAAGAGDGGVGAVRGGGLEGTAARQLEAGGAAHGGAWEPVAPASALAVVAGERGRGSGSGARLPRGDAGARVR